MRGGVSYEDHKGEIMNIAVFASGKGSNFSAISRAVRKGKIKANVALLVCDNPKALVLQKARRAGVPVALVTREDFASTQEFEAKIIQELQTHKIEVIALAGFMRLLSPEFVHKFYGRIINIHPSLLPAFKGAEAIKDALEYGVTVTGVTVHFVDEQMDHGPIILQQALKIDEGESLALLEARIHKIEHTLYPAALALFAQGRVTIQGRKVKVSSP